MEEKNTKILIAVVVILAAALAVVSIAGFGKPRVTGAAVAGQNSYEGVLFGKGLSFVDDITCKEWNLCFHHWEFVDAGGPMDSSSATLVIGDDSIIIPQYASIAMADADCVWSMFALLFYGDPYMDPPVEGWPSDDVHDGFIPIPADCLVQKDPTITTPPQVTPGEGLPY